MLLKHTLLQPAHIARNSKSPLITKEMLIRAARVGREDTRRACWNREFTFRTKEEYDAYITGVHRQASPGSSNRRQRKYADEQAKYWKLWRDGAEQ